MSYHCGAYNPMGTIPQPLSFNGWIPLKQDPLLPELVNNDQVFKITELSKVCRPAWGLWVRDKNKKRGRIVFCFLNVARIEDEFNKHMHFVSTNGE